MTVYISADAKNLREELASLRNQGGYEERQFYFDGLVTNGTFDSATTGWTAYNSATLSVVSQQLKVQGTGASFPQAYQAVAVTVGKTYTVSVDFDRDASASQVYVSLGTNVTGVQYGQPTSTNATGTLTTTFTATTATLYISLVASGTVDHALFDNVSIFETDGTDVVHRMPKGWVPLHVYEDGLLQREGAAHDYEVVYDGFDYYVKPAVTPGATTETCVIGVRK